MKSYKNDTHKAMCRHSIEDNTNRYDGMKNKGKKVVSKAMREKVEEALTELEIIHIKCLD